jgi:hypothetical protein
MQYVAPELALVGDARGIVLGGAVGWLPDTICGTPWSVIKPYSTRLD